ncbi:MAG: hypothetical protein HY692_09885 [Cyanobacteria bacterium NC_groundwater_1444_Ag_S-0.65um_54_12]|nr:hypothetical protein [Cyanobacteria bacterium NC_groundwater_1444_Ag_S-0.65um_54_12]
MNERAVCKITSVVNNSVFPTVISALERAGVRYVYSAAGRTAVLDQRRGWYSAFRPGPSLSDDPVHVVRFFVDHAVEEAVMALLVQYARLQNPGMGSIYSEDAIIAKSHPFCRETLELQDMLPPAKLYRDLVGVCCIVQRGEGDVLCRAALEAGAVPTVTYGIGTGIRDKLGLLRITIPAEKEVITLLTGTTDVSSLLEILIETGKLDQPGRGFIYTFPVRQGLIDTRISRGGTAHVASIEQIVTALDHMCGGMEWRQVGHDQAAVRLRPYFTGIDFSLICEEVRGPDLVKSAMAAGAPGATIEQLKIVNDCGIDKISPARVSCRMVVPQEMVANILAAVDRAGAFDDVSHGIVVQSPIPRAFTYLPKRDG